MRLALTLVFASTLTAAASEPTAFTAVINNLGAIAPGGTTSTETGMTGFATFELAEPATGSPTLAYDIRFEGVDFLFTDGDLSNDVTAVHLHDTTGVDHSAGTPHVLNLYGFPAFDDDDLTIDAAGARLTGVWDDSDLSEGMLAGNPMGNSDTLSSMLTALKAGELYVMLHTESPNALPGTTGITIGGQIVGVPEPAAGALLLLTLCGGVACRRA